MHDAFAPRKTTAGRLLLVAPLVALLGGCAPDREGGYDHVAFREREPLPQATNPPPPPVIPGLVQTAAVRLVANNLPAGVTQAMVDAGQDKFGTVCAGCHGVGGTGSASAPALNDNQWLDVPGDYPSIVQVITTGVPNPKQYPAPMPPRGGGNFDDEGVRELAAYVYALSHQGGA